MQQPELGTSGAKPVFVDIKDDLNIDENKMEKKITKKTKAIVPVHWSGRICNMEKIIKIAKKYKLHIVEDACHAILAYDNKKKNLLGILVLLAVLACIHLKISMYGEMVE